MNDRDAAVSGDAQAGGSAGASGITGGGGTGGTAGGPSECHPNPDTGNEVCTEICPERCNGQDDDCDLMIDEGEASEECQRPHTEASCVFGQGCVITNCKDGYRDCDGKGATGCEIAPNDPLNCGTCGNVCAVTHGTATCVDDECVQDECAKGFADCDDDPLTCETQTNTLDDCSACNVECKDLPNAVPTCGGGSCTVESCTLGYGDCDKSKPGCEQDLNTLANCGACKHACDFAGSADECLDGKCFAKANGCDKGYDDCDGKRENGCEPLTTDQNCGGCAKVCVPNAAQHSVAPTACDDGDCDLHCETGYGDCDGDFTNGCETHLITTGDCGVCHKKCNPAHAIGTCDSGSCEVQDCDTGFGDCSGGAANGCETPTDTVSDCGSCGNDCESDQTCSGGQCSDVNCALAPWKDQCGASKCGNCDNDTTCETNLTTVTNCGSCGNACTPNPGVTLNGTLTCAAQGCKASCSAGFADCNGDYRDGCEQSLKTLANCGACGQTCAVANGTPTCATGTCLVSTCNVDYDDCDNDDKSCEAQLNTPNKCGVCGFTCNLANAVEGCGGTAGARVCTISACDQSYYKNCDMQTPNGCEIDTRTDKLNCGACGMVCENLANVTTASCAASACSITACDPGYGDCSGGVANGCETPLNTVANCGACANNCDTVLANTATTSCDSATLTCKIGTCDAGFASCDSSQSNGCETSTTSTANCGSCGNNCQALPHVATTTCSGGTTCAVSTCATNYANCDGIASNGCERDIRSPAMGGQGPCLPEGNCAKFTSGGHEYYFCPTVRQWADARTKCQLQQYGDLAQIADATENAFVLSHVTAAQTWIGAGDGLVEGLWRWAYNNVPFWRGTSTGMAIDGLYANWDAGEPNSSGNCSQFYKSNGKWDDTGCSATLAYVCEVYPDACPSDAAKYDPGQCGCGVADTDADNDGFATCKDSCSSDANKIAPGICGCGVSDVNTDGDSQVDCKETCDSDPAKLAPGICGCGVADTNTDGDSKVDCEETCDTDPAKLAPGICGCGVADTNTDGDSKADCEETCDMDPAKLAPGQCGCGNPDTDDDSDGTANCNDQCPSDPGKIVPGVCGCGVADTNTDGDSQLDCNETCDSDPAKLAPGVCGCGVADTNSDGDTQVDCNETCDSDPNKLTPGQCGCGAPDSDSDADGTANCVDGCPFDAANGAGCFKTVTSTVDPLQWSFASSPTWTCNAAGTTTVDSTAGTVTSTSCALGSIDVTNNVAQKRPGLLYGKITGGWNTTTANPANLAYDPLGPSITELNTEVASGTNERWVDGVTYVYSGEIYITPSGVASFMEHIDDYVYLKIDSTVVLNDTAWTTPTAGKFTGTPGWHSFELRLLDATGGQGPSAQPPTGLPALGYSPTDTAGSTNFALYTWPRNVDSATATLFRIPLASASPNVMVVRLKGLTVSNSHLIKVVGDKPVVFLVAGDVNVTSGGVIDASGSGVTPGAGGNWSCGTSSGTAGGGSSSSNGTGGGGGGFQTVGGDGGDYTPFFGGASGGAHGVTRGSFGQSPFIGGCNGGNGGGCASTGAGGGGALQISAGGNVVISSIVRANGGVGVNGCGSEGGGGGGGSGGALIIEGNTVNVTSGTIEARGGNGGSHNGSAGAGSAARTSNGSNGGNDSGGGAGGGGGGYGWRRVIAATTCTSCPAIDPPATPDSNCSYFENNGHGYYFCTNGKAWTAARDACRASTTKMQLLRVDSSAENTFAASHMVASTWLGGNDLSMEGAWRWSALATNDGPQFWSGPSSTAGGAAVAGLYSAWSSGEPNDAGGNEDCSETSSAGLWNDNACTVANDFACEYTP